MWHRHLFIVALVALAACDVPVVPFSKITEDAPDAPHRVGGNVHGLWDGTDGVALRLQATGTDALLAVPVNGAFHFAELFDPETSYTVTVATNPVQHTCVVDGGGNGMVADADVTSVSIACTGPEVSIALSGPWNWTFDSTQETQAFTGSIAMQDVVLTVSGSELTGASINGTETALARPATALKLPVGTTVVPVTVSTSSGSSKTYQLMFDRGSSLLEQAVYGKASNAGANDLFGYSVALSGDTLVVGAQNESSSATGVDPVGGQADNSAINAGAVYVFVRTGTMWSQQAYLKASNTTANHRFGGAVTLFGDTLVVGADGANAVYVFVRTGTTWTQQANLMASNADAGDSFGVSVALAGDTLVVGADGESSAATGVNPAGGQADNTAAFSGAVYVFVRTGMTWTQQAYLKASNTGKEDRFGISVALSGDTLAVGAPLEASASTGENAAGGQTDNSKAGAGAVYVFVRTGTTWTQQAYLKASNTGLFNFFGNTVALSGDTLAVGAQGEASAAIGINPAGGQSDRSSGGAGAVYVFVRASDTWLQQAYVKASNTGAQDNFGASVTLFGDMLAVGAPQETSAATGVNPASGQTDNSTAGAGAVYVFVRTGTTWTQQAYLKASNTGANDFFGSTVALSGDTVVVGASFESSAATGLNPAGGQTDDSASNAGAVYVFR